MCKQRSVSIQRGDIYYADLADAVGSEQGGFRPVLVIQNDVGNQYSHTTIVAAITGQLKSRHMPTHVLLAASSCGLSRDSMVMLEQIRTLDRDRLQSYMGCVKPHKMREIDAALGISIGLVHLPVGEWTGITYK